MNFLINKRFISLVLITITNVCCSHPIENCTSSKSAFNSKIEQLCREKFHFSSNDIKFIKRVKIISLICEYIYYPKENNSTGQRTSLIIAQDNEGRLYTIGKRDNYPVAIAEVYSKRIKKQYDKILNEIMSRKILNHYEFGYDFTDGEGTQREYFFVNANAMKYFKATPSSKLKNAIQEDDNPKDSVSFVLVSFLDYFTNKIKSENDLLGYIRCLF